MNDYRELDWVTDEELEMWIADGYELCLAGDLSEGDQVLNPSWPVETVVVDRVEPAGDGGSNLLIFNSGKTIRAKSCEFVLARLS